jgi:hypothetical protein
VLSREKDGVVLYRLLAIMPGIFEFQFMRGTDTEHDRRLARMFKAYLDIAGGVVTKTLTAVKEATPPRKRFRPDKRFIPLTSFHAISTQPMRLQSGIAIAGIRRSYWERKAVMHPANAA